MAVNQNPDLPKIPTQTYLSLRNSRQSRIKGQGGPGQFLLEGPYDVIRDVIVYNRYVFAYLQGSRLLFPIVENVLTQLYLQVAASREFMI